MKRNVDNLKDKEFDLLVIGGGITGACAAHDAALRGLSVALVEMKDFAWATSSATSKLIHGGLRYLKNLEFGLVRESLRERRYMEVITPHQVYPFPFLVPTYTGSSNSRMMLYPGMMLYDVLSYDKGWLNDPERKIPHFKLLTKDKVKSIVPDVNPEGLTGGAIYYDCQMYAPERHTLDFIKTAFKNGAVISNYTKVVEILKKHGRVVGAKVQDLLGGESFDIKAKVTVNVGGPWADFVSGLGVQDSHAKLVRSEGIHLITKPLVNGYALVYRTPSGRHFFIIPWRGRSLIGTTDTVYKGSPDEYGVSETNVLEFIDEINASHPAANLTMDDIEFTYGGLRPIVEDETEVEVEVYDASRKYEILDHAETDRIDNFFTVIGGKYTTSRQLAETLIDQVFDKLKLESPPCMTTQTPLIGGNFPSWADLVNEAKAKFPELDNTIMQNLLHSYGKEYELVLEAARIDSTQMNKISDHADAIWAQVSYAVTHEMAVQLEDVITRRTGLSLLGKMTKRQVDQCGRIMGEILGWDEETITQQVDHVRTIIENKGMKYRL